MRFKPPNCKRLQGAADVLWYFKCLTTKQMRCPVNAYQSAVPGNRRRPTILGENKKSRDYAGCI
jgi:hypothetical protein